MPEYDAPVLTNPTPDGGPRRVVIVTNRSSNTLEYLGFLQVFAETQYFLKISNRPPAYKVEVITHGTGTIYACEGLEIIASKSFDKLRGNVDTIVFQAIGDSEDCLLDTRFIQWVARTTLRVRRIVSACTGAFILAEAGILDGRVATTHWAAAEDFRSRYPKVRLDTEQLYAKDDQIYTSGGVTASINLAIALVEEDLGPEVARRVAQGLVTYMKRPGNQSQFNASQCAGEYHEAGNEFERYIRQNLDKDLRLETLADHFNMSLRNFNRNFREQFGSPPGQFIEKCRVTQARRLLEGTREPISTIAMRTGFSTTNGLRLAFIRSMSVSPRAYRKRFSTSL